MTKKDLKDILARELLILVVILFIGYFFEMVYFIFKEGPLGPALPFWKDRYAYQIWNNSLRENAHLLRFFGYPLLLIVRFLFWAVKIPESKEIEKLQHKTAQVKILLDGIAKEINLDRQIDNVIYRSEYAWYIIRFNFPPSCLIPAEVIYSYLKNRDKESRDKIIDSLLFRDKNTK